MSFFECCHYCKAPKRYPGCHDKCPDYIGSKKLWDAHKEAERLARAAEPPMSSAQVRAMRRNQQPNRK